MHAYDVHAFCTVRIKIPSVLAETPERAIASAMEDERVSEEISRLINHEGMTGPIETIEYQDGDIPIAHQVDEADPERHEANTAGFAYRTDDMGRILRVRSLMPTAFQDAVIEAFGGVRMIVATDDAEAASMRLRGKGHDEAAVLMRRLAGVSDRTEAVRTVEAIRDAMDRVLQNLGRCEPDLDLPATHRQ